MKFTEAGEMAFEMERGREVVAFWVRDTATGIRPEHLGKVFEAFCQLDATATRDAGGTGTGRDPRTADLNDRFLCGRGRREAGRRM